MADEVSSGVLKEGDRLWIVPNRGDNCAFSLSVGVNAVLYTLGKDGGTKIFADSGDF